jgi:hypothetical protein
MVLDLQELIVLKGVERVIKTTIERVLAIESSQQTFNLNFNEIVFRISKCS